jgi:pimeloyl-ACP methyl ester carboxylesterase
MLIGDMFEPWSTLVGAGALAAYSYSEYYEGGAGLARWLQEPYATQLPERAESQCLMALGLWVGFRADRVFQPEMVAAVRDQQWAALQPWLGYLDSNTPGNFTSDVPVLVLQGEADRLVSPEASRQLQRRLCARGTSATLSLYPGVGHLVPDHALPESLQWMADRLSEIPVTDSCAEVLFHTYAPAVSRGM